MNSRWQKFIHMAAWFAMPIASALAQTNGVGNPVQSSFKPIPSQSYAPIDISGTTAPADVWGVALDDGNNAAFASSIPGEYGYDGNTPDTSGTCYTYTWQGGNISSGPITTLQLTQCGPAPGFPGSSLNKTYYPSVVFPNGKLAGSVWYPDGDIWVVLGDGSVSSPSTGFWSSTNDFGTPYPFLIGEFGEIDGAIFSKTGSQAMFEGAFSWVATETGTVYCNPYQYTLWQDFNMTFTGGGSPTMFFGGENDVGVPVGNNIIAKTFQPCRVNNTGAATGYDENQNAIFWSGSGSNMTPLSPMEAVCSMNDNNQVVGVTDSNGYLWTSPSTSSTCQLVQSGKVQLISQLIPQQYQGEVSKISPIDISGTDANGRVRILFNAQYQADANSDWASGTFILALESGTTTVLQHVALPSTVSATLNTPNLNAQAIIAETGTTAATGTSQHALLLVPAELAVDANRDGTISLTGTGGNDQTSQSQPYTFWLNDDQDDPNQGDVVPVQSPDYNLTYIESKRDLEDWTRLWVSLKGSASIIKGIINNGGSVGLQFEALSSGTDLAPSIRICQAVESSGSTGYLTDDGIAGQQIAAPYGQAITSKGGQRYVGTDAFLLPNNLLNNVDDNTPLHLIFEGLSEGKGKLKLVFYDSNNNKIGEGGACYINIRNIKRMYLRAKGTPENGIPSPYNSLNPSITNQKTSWEGDPNG